MQFRIFAAALSAGVAGCTTPPLAPGEPRIVERVVIAPYQLHDQCVRLETGDRLDWRYESSEPVAFNIHYREGNADMSPIVREHSMIEAGTFDARMPQAYCLTWEAGAAGAIIGYRMLLRPAAR